MKTEYAWCAGFYDGEGSAEVANRRAQIKAAQVDREPLDRMKSALGGKVYGPYGPYDRSRPNTKPIYVWCAYGPGALTAMRRMWPYLGNRKKDQYIEKARKALG
jgi:hypothetical protein